METDLLEYGDIFNGSHVMNEKVESLKAEALAELAKIDGMGGAVAALETKYLKEALVQSNTARLKKIESGDQTVIGVNAFKETAESPLANSSDGGILTVPESVEFEQIARLEEWRKARDGQAVTDALVELQSAAKEGRNIMPASIEAARVGVTTGEWGTALREIYGEYRAPTGVIIDEDTKAEEIAEVRAKVDKVSDKLGQRLKLLVGKPGLDGHSNGAEQIAVRAGDVGMAVVYDGIRLTPEELVTSAKREGVNAIGLSILSGSHVPLMRDVMGRLRSEGMDNIPVVVGGIIPDEDRLVLKQMGVTAVFTPKDYMLNQIMSEIVDLVDAR